MLLFYTFALLASAAPPLAQSAPGSDPSCAAELAWAADYASRNYSGFEVKVTSSNRAEYTALLRELEQAAARATSTHECDALLARWTAFFRDGHLSFGRAAAGGTGGGGAASPDEIRGRFAGWERSEVSEEEVRQRLAVRNGERSPIEGIWESMDRRYRTAVLRDRRDDRDYTMTILRADSVWWVPGQVKATFTRRDGGYATRFYMLDHSERQWTGQVRGNLLQFDGGSPWFRVWPDDPGDVSRDSLLSSLNTRFAARTLAPGTVLMQIPTFGNPRAIDSLWLVEGGRILTAERLIIDLRGNGGGSDFNYRHLIPLIYTGPIHVAGSSALATEENIRAHEVLANDSTFPAAQRASMRQMIETIRTANGGWYVWPDRTHEEKTAMPNPREIAIIVDRGCASSCEQFLLAARQSAKVTIYGDRSAGVLDFGNVRSARMPSGSLILHHPTTRTNRIPHEPVDPEGIQPHVQIPHDELFPVQWVLSRMGQGSERAERRQRE